MTNLPTFQCGHEPSPCRPRPARRASASGYDLLKTFNQSLANVWPATQSQLYSELTRLADEGLLTAAAEGPRRRKEYALTPAGRQELQRWLTEVEPERPRRNDMLLRVFFLGTLSPQEARDFLLHEAGAAEERHDSLRRLQQSTPWDEESLSLHGRLALEYGLRLTAMQREWARWAADQVSSPRSAPPRWRAMPSRPAAARSAVLLDPPDLQRRVRQPVVVLTGSAARARTRLSAQAIGFSIQRCTAYALAIMMMHTAARRMWGSAVPWSWLKRMNPM